jgi:hypothetical protein
MTDHRPPGVAVIYHENHLRVVLVFPNGERFMHDHKFKQIDMQKADNFRTKVLTHLAEGGELQWGHWNEIAPLKNSPADHFSR